MTCRLSYNPRPAPAVCAQHAARMARRKPVRILRSDDVESVGNLCARKSLRKMSAAQRHVALVAADLDLRAFAFGRAIGLDTHHHDGLAAAMADGLDLDQVVG